MAAVSNVPPGQPTRVLSGMRPTGRLHLGHYHGVLKNWVRLQHEYECFYFVADWHALTTHYEEPDVVRENIWDMVIDWLAADVDPHHATLFIQSHVPQHAELHTLLSMITPLSWLERVPSYKDQQLQLKDRDLSTFGFLGYPLLQSADILIYRAGLVPVGEDQVAHVELTREIARRFNHLYGRKPGYEDRAKEAIKKLGKKTGTLYRELRTGYLEKGDRTALEKARALLEKQKNISIGDKERLYGYLEGGGKIILPEPQALLTPSPKVPGLDGQKMSKSYNNIIALRDEPDEIEQKMRTMPTDPARVRRSDPGDPEKCPVWPFHQVYSDDDTRRWVQEGCRTAGIGCIECKKKVIDAVIAELEPIRKRAADYSSDPTLVKNIIAEGCERAQDAAEETLTDVRQAMGLAYH
ncbi:MAG: tryptophan--tRNA ligase [Proteobacteria bacterium]|nr:MAG: tryptophan--tRNA ligase [Pseudomonadota bacterium]TDJ70473.1 MAG: tryptophan--tRNA ligase [Pseudomonadota bacterium]